MNKMLLIILVVIIVAILILASTTDLVPTLGPLVIIFPVVLLAIFMGYRAIKTGRIFWRYASLGVLWGLALPWVVILLSKFIPGLLVLFYLDFTLYLFCVIEDCSEAWFLQIFTIFISFPLMGLICGIFWGRHGAKLETEMNAAGAPSPRQTSNRIFWLLLVFIIAAPFITLALEGFRYWRQEQKSNEAFLLREEQLLYIAAKPENYLQCMDFSDPGSCFTLAAMKLNRLDFCTKVEGESSKDHLFSYERVGEKEIKFCEKMVEFVQSGRTDENFCEIFRASNDSKDFYCGQLLKLYREQKIYNLD